jgi:hypothetical protein
MTSDDMKDSKGLVLPVVAMAGLGFMPAKGADEQAAARVSPRLLLTVIRAADLDGSLRYEVSLYQSNNFR